MEYLQTARDGFGALLRDFQSMHAKVFLELPQQLASLEQRVQSLEVPQTNAGARQGERVQDVDETSQHRGAMERFGGAVSGRSSKSSQMADWNKRVEKVHNRIEKCETGCHKAITALERKFSQVREEFASVKLLGAVWEQWKAEDFAKSKEFRALQQDVKEINEFQSSTEGRLYKVAKKELDKQAQEFEDWFNEARTMCNMLLENLQYHPLPQSGTAAPRGRSLGMTTETLRPRSREAWERYRDKVVRGFSPGGHCLSQEEGVVLHQLAIQRVELEQGQA